LAVEIFLIILIGLALFRSLRIILLSKLPCLIPLIITAGLMGYFGIRFKPSTILIFSIAFGISSDGTIYFLSRFRQELQSRTQTYVGAVHATILETGRSMIYTNIILFAGFFIFALSDFWKYCCIRNFIVFNAINSNDYKFIVAASHYDVNRRQNGKETFKGEVGYFLDTIIIIFLSNIDY
jgi:predicted RND superfamily exporter protein